LIVGEVWRVLRQSPVDVDKRLSGEGEAARRDLKAAQHHPTVAVMFASVCHPEPWFALTSPERQ
jgi:hypothetical protein